MKLYINDCPPLLDKQELFKELQKDEASIQPETWEPQEGHSLSLITKLEKTCVAYSQRIVLEPK